MNSYALSITYGHAANFTEDELGQQLLDVVLEPGDLLYFPRGFTHQVITTLHIYDELILLVPE